MKRYYLHMENNENEFYKFCKLIEDKFPELKKEELLVDIDNSLVQPYKSKEVNITVINDVEEDIIYARTDIDLSKHITTL